MCYTISIKATRQEIENRFGIQEPEEVFQFSPVYYSNAFETPNLPVITSHDPGRLNFYIWGLIPSWVKDSDQARKMRYSTFNAKAETVFEKPSFRRAIAKSRCLVAVTGFFEWHTDKKSKIPYYIHLRDHEIFALAGIYEKWEDPVSKKELVTVSIVTTEANPLMAKIHNEKKRMPVILDAANEKSWIDKTLPKEKVQSLMKPYDASMMKAYPASNLVKQKDAFKNIPEILLQGDYPGHVPLA